MKDFIVIIPARLKSTRLPNKPLVDLLGKTLIQRTFEQCAKAVNPDLIYVATDSEEIRQHCENLGIQVVLTSSEHLTGTDRVAEVAMSIDARYYVNVQGDEPLFNPDDLNQAIAAISKYEGHVINGYTAISEDDQFTSRSIPKVVFRPDGRLLYMSRSAIPGNKNGLFQKSWRQICIYCFPKNALLDFSSQKQKTPLEAEEDIEILRFLEIGYDVYMIPLSNESVAVDTPDDVEKVLRILKLKES